MNDFYSKTSDMRYSLQYFIFKELPYILTGFVNSRDSGGDVLSYHHRIADVLQQWERETFLELNVSAHITCDMLANSDYPNIEKHLKRRMAQEIGMKMLESGSIFFTKYRPDFRGEEIKAQVLVLRNNKANKMCEGEYR